MLKPDSKVVLHLNYSNTRSTAAEQNQKAVGIYCPADMKWISGNKFLI